MILVGTLHERLSETCELFEQRQITSSKLREVRHCGLLAVQERCVAQKSVLLLKNRSHI